MRSFPSSWTGHRGPAPPHPTCARHSTSSTSTNASRTRSASKPSLSCFTDLAEVRIEFFNHQQISELLAVPGIEYVDPLPSEGSTRLRVFGWRECEGA